MSLYKDGLKKFENYDEFKSIQIIAPSKKGIVGTKELNKKIQELTNPEGTGKKEKGSRRHGISRGRQHNANEKQL